MPKTPAPVWKEFKIQPCKEKAKCNHCEQLYTCKGGTTTSMLNHLKGSHESIYNEIQDNKNKKRCGDILVTNSKQLKLDALLPPSQEALQKKVDEAIVDFLADTGVALRIVELESFKKLLKVANNKIDLKCRKTYTKMIEMKGEEIREDIAGIINFVKEDTKSISFTTDAWTSLSGDPFLSLTIQLIDCDWNLLCFTPFVRPFPGNHSGLNIAVCLDGMIEELGIDSTAWELFSVNDNASNMKLGIKLSKYLNEYNCDIHTLELAVKDSFKNTVGMNDALKSAKSLAQFVNKSPLAQSNLKDECLKQNIHYKKIVNPPNTRWSGYQSTLASVCALKIPLINLMHSDNSSWSEHIIHSDQWKLMEGAVQLLKPIR